MRSWATLGGHFFTLRAPEGPKEGPRGALGGEAVFKMALLGASWGVQGSETVAFSGVRKFDPIPGGSHAASGATPGAILEPFW